MITNRLQRISVSLEWPKTRDRHLDVDNRFGCEARDRGRAVMINPQGDTVQGSSDSRGLSFEFDWPGWIVRHNLQLFIHQAITARTTCELATNSSRAGQTARRFNCVFKRIGADKADLGTESR